MVHGGACGGRGGVVLQVRSGFCRLRQAWPGREAGNLLSRVDFGQRQWRCTTTAVPAGNLRRLRTASALTYRLRTAALPTYRLRGAFLLTRRLRGAVLLTRRLRGAVLLTRRLRGAVLLTRRVRGAVLLTRRLRTAFLLTRRLQPTCRGRGLLALLRLRGGVGWLRQAGLGGC
jgi:hypothetical protein